MSSVWDTFLFAFIYIDTQKHTSYIHSESIISVEKYTGLSRMCYVAIHHAEPKLLTQFIWPEQHERQAAANLRTRRIGLKLRSACRQLLVVH